MGFSLIRFTKRVDKEFLCPICHLVFDKAVESPHCQHIYCKKCIESWLKKCENNKTATVCPIDKKALKLEEVKPIPINLMKLLHKLEIKCDFELKGCQTLLTLENLENHVKSCTFDPNSTLFCSKQCGLQMARRESINHCCLTKLAQIVKKQTNDISALKEQIKDLKKNQNWISFSDGITVSDNNAIECSKAMSGYERSRFVLNEIYAYFEFKIVELGKNSLSIGLSYTPNPSQTERKTDECEFKTLLLYGCSGILYMYFDGIMTDEVCGSVWNNGDIIGCGVKFPRNYALDCAEIYFKRNHVVMSKITKHLPSLKLFPTVFMNNKSNAGFKVLVN